MGWIRRLGSGLLDGIQPEWLFVAALALLAWSVYGLVQLGVPELITQAAARLSP